jgi:hypothetical protein
MGETIISNLLTHDVSEIALLDLIDPELAIVKSFAP